jgi:hypothetical protein
MQIKKLLIGIIGTSLLSCHNGGNSQTNENKTISGHKDATNIENFQKELLLF